MNKKLDHRVDSSGFVPTPKSPLELRASFSMITARMLIKTEKGLYCPAGDFYIDPMGAAERAVITHAHSDHARRGSQQYYCTKPGVGLLRARLGKNISVHGIDYREKIQFGGVQVSFHAAGHILGSAQIRMEGNGEVWVVSGDYKREADPTCEPFEPVPCDVFVTEATFGTPGYRWHRDADLGREIFDWWQENAARGCNSVLFAYALGKSQRVLGALAPLTKRAVYCHPAVTEINKCYRESGIVLAPTHCLSEVESSRVLRGELVLVPPAFLQSEQAQVLGDGYRTAFASGWMSKRATDGKIYGYGDGYDHGFVMSDHADWADLVRTVLETGAQRVYVQHRGQGALVRHLRSLGLRAYPDSALKPENPHQLSLFL